MITCPRCKKRTFDVDNVQDYSLSRKDNREDKKICNPCGTEEAFEDMR